MIAITDKSGISSAQNLQITALAVSGIGITDTHMAQPTKKMIVFIDTDRTFFIQYTSLSNSNINVSTQKARRNLTKITARLMEGYDNLDILESHLSFKLASDDSRIGITTTVESNSKNLAHESSLPRYTNRTMSNKRSSITVVTSRNMYSRCCHLGVEDSLCTGQYIEMRMHGFDRVQVSFSRITRHHILLCPKMLIDIL